MAVPIRGLTFKPKRHSNQSRCKAGIANLLGAHDILLGFSRQGRRGHLRHGTRRAQGPPTRWHRGRAGGPVGHIHIPRFHLSGRLVGDLEGLVRRCCRSDLPVHRDHGNESQSLRHARDAVTRQHQSIAAPYSIPTAVAILHQAGVSQFAFSGLADSATFRRITLGCRNRLWAKFGHDRSIPRHAQFSSVMHGSETRT